MAELLVAARDLDTGYKKGDPITVLPDGWSWGTLDTLPNNWQVVIAGLPTQIVLSMIAPLWELAIPGDPEFDLEADETDRRIVRGRRSFRVVWDEIPTAWLDLLDATGRLEVQLNEMQPFMRKLRYNRGQSRVELTNLRVF